MKLTYITAPLIFLIESLPGILLVSMVFTALNLGKVGLYDEIGVFIILSFTTMFFYSLSAIIHFLAQLIKTQGYPIWRKKTLFWGIAKAFLFSCFFLLTTDLIRNIANKKNIEVELWIGFLIYLAVGLVFYILLTISEPQK